LYLIARDFQPPAQEEARILIDAEVPPAYLNPDLIKVVEFFEPFGEGSPPLTFLTRRVRIESLEIVGRREAAHVKLLLSADRYRWPAVFWNAAERAGKDFAREDLVDIVFRLGRNYFMNTETLQLTLVDLKR
jgi:single-stranded-DNA-specific exonuclease